MKAIWRRSTGSAAEDWKEKKPVAARTLREMDFCWRSIENNLRVLKIAEIDGGENSDLEATQGSFHFLGWLVSNHFEDLLFCLTVFLFIYKTYNHSRDK